MKKTIAVVLAVLTLLALTACGKEAGEIPSQIYAIIMDVDPENRSILVCDADDGRIFGSGTHIDCREIPVRPEGSDAQEVSFLDLVPGDRTLLTFDEKGRKALAKGEETVEPIRVEVGPAG